MNKPLDRAFNVAVRHIAGRLMPTGFDVAPVAPETFADLKEHVARTGRMLVYSGSSDDTIFGDPDTNHAFRAWHDWCHLHGNHDFTPDGEAAACLMMGVQLVALYGRETARPWLALLDAEINGQVRYFAECGGFPDSQTAFMRSHLERCHPDLAERYYGAPARTPAMV